MLKNTFTVLYCLSIAAVFSLSGCSKSNDHGIDLHSVSGKIMRAGEPLANAEVKFYPVDPQQLKSGVPIPVGTTDDSGKFKLRTYEPGDGAPTGEYAVTVQQPESYETPGGQLEERDLLKGAYSNPKQPVTTVTVESGSNKFDSIELN